MADENVQEETTTQDQDVNITVEQICAAILQTAGSVVVPIENLLGNYSGMNIAVTQDEDTKAVTFSLAAAVVENTENPEESE
jgi:hypothetical protein